MALMLTAVQVWLLTSPTIEAATIRVREKIILSMIVYRKLNEEDVTIAGF
jgi:hypothetical protein